MINNLKKKTRKDDVLFAIKVIVIFLIVVYVLVPPRNKFQQLCYVGNNIKFFVSKIVNKEQTMEYVFHRNQSVYLAKMYPNNKDVALKELERAFATLPEVAPKQELLRLYKDRAELELFFGGTREALRDYLLAKDMLGYDDLLKVAMLFKEEGNYREAVKYCTRLSELNQKSYAGFACKAELYNSLDRADIALTYWDKAIDKNPNNAYVYVERARVKKNMGDLTGADEDIKLAKEHLSNVDEDFSMAENAIAPKKLSLEIRRI